MVFKVISNWLIFDKFCWDFENGVFGFIIGNVVKWCCFCFGLLILM